MNWNTFYDKSHPVRMRGLKFLLLLLLARLVLVASRADAWIEIVVPALYDLDFEVASRADAWIEIHVQEGKYDYRLSRIPCGCVD